MSSKLPKTLLSRSAELIKLAAKVSGEEIAHRMGSSDLLTKQLDQAKLLVDSLGRLKGAAMKVGQLLSMDFADLFPEEVRVVLEKLQGSSPHFLAYSEIESILKSEWMSLEMDPFLDLKNISIEPIAAASIGQVHRAQWKGRDIVLKIQYPGISDSIDSDLSLLRGVVKSFLTMARKKIDVDKLFDELTNILKQEADYLSEMKMLLHYGDLAKNEVDYVVPEAIPELSTSKVLAMTYMEGVCLRDWMKNVTDLNRRKKMGQRVLDLYSWEFFKNAYVQTDPNPSNFLVDKEDRLILLDFGAVKSFERTFVKEYVRLIEFVYQKDIKATVEQSIKMKFLDERETPKVKEAFYEMLRASLCAFDDNRQPFDFTSRDYFEYTKTAGNQFGKLSKYTPPPYEIVFLHRKLVGIFGILKDLRLDMDLRPYWKRVRELAQG